MDFQLLLTFTMLCIVLSASPGPSSLFITSVSLQHGFKKSMNTVYGEVLGWAIYLLPVICGLGVFIQSNQDLLIYVKYIGGAYLMYMAYQAFMADSLELKTTDKKISDKDLFKKGFVTSVTNPKVMMYYAAFLPQFIRPGNEALQLTILSALDLTIGFVIYTFYAYATHRIRTLISGHIVEKYVNKVSAVIYALVGIMIVL